jgi:hypothetical protein
MGEDITRVLLSRAHTILPLVVHKLLAPLSNANHVQKAVAVDVFKVRSLERSITLGLRPMIAKQ